MRSKLDRLLRKKRKVPTTASTTPGPSTAPPFILPSSGSQKYPDSADLYVGDLTNGFLSTSGLPQDYTVISSLVGFTYGVALNSEKYQCLVKEQYVPNEKKCEINPKDCTTGLSFSIWTRVYYNTSDVIDPLNALPEHNKYFLSTGGDSSGHPGIAVGVRKIWLFALVSTGDQVWEVNILGPLANETWNNIGVKWTPGIKLDVYMNGTLAGSTDKPKTTLPLPGHSPPLMMVGCHKAAGDSAFKGYVDADLDEIALWTEVLNKTENFLGGYAVNGSEMGASQFESIVINIVLSDPQQQSQAVDILSQMISKINIQQDASNDSSVANQTAATTDEQVDDLKTLANTIMKLLNETKLPKTTSPADAVSFLKIAGPVSGILSSKNDQKWIALQKETEEVGPIQIMAQFGKWHAQLARAIRLDNTTRVFCHEQLEENLYLKFCKMPFKDLREMTEVIQLPDYTSLGPKTLRDMWNDTLIDRVAFPSYVVDDERCDLRPVTYLFHMYNIDKEIIATVSNPMYVPIKAIKTMDTRIMNIDFIIDYAIDSFGNINTSQQLCIVEELLLRRNPVISKAMHESRLSAKILPKRRLQLFENMTISDILERFCVWWNQNLSDFGAWDGEGCVMADTNEDYSTCSCGRFGMYSVLVVKSEPVEVPDEQYWLTLVKYVLYALSAFAVTLYIIVVGLSGDLKDMFHLMGVNVAVAILLGSISMVLTDFEKVVVDRTTCAIFGTLIHGFYGSLGVWMFALGHATFKGITKGIIGGRLLVYMAISWGLGIACMGIPYVAMYSEMGYDPRCFIGWENEVKWVFFGPQLFYSFVSMFFAAIVLCNVSTSALRKENLIQDYGSFCRGGALLLIQLSVTWILGLFAYIRFGFKSPDFYPIFQVLNALSGLSLFVFIGLGSHRFRTVLIGQAKERRDMLKKYAFGFPSANAVSAPEIWPASKSKKTTLG